MPYSNIPPDKVADMDRCVAQVQAQGHDQDSAIAICYASIVEGSALPEGHAVGKRALEHVEAQATPHDPEGSLWDVTIIGPAPDQPLVTHKGEQYVQSKNGRLYAVRGLVASVPLWDGVHVYDNHLTDAEFEAKGGMRSVSKEWLGTLTDPTWDTESHSLKATLHLVDGPTRQKLVNAHEAKVLGSIGLSIDTIPIGGKATIHEGQYIDVIEGFSQIFSVDLVAKPAAGGRFDRLIAAEQRRPIMSAFSDEQREEIKALVAEALKVPEADQAVGAEMTPDEAAEEVLQAGAEVAAEAPPEADPVEVAQAVADAAQAEADALAQAEEPEPMPEASPDAVQRLESQILLRDMLNQAKLSPQAAKIVLDAFAGQTVAREKVSRMVEQIRQVEARGDPTGRVQGAGGHITPKVGLNGDDWKQLEFMRLLMGNMAFRRLEARTEDVVLDRMRGTRVAESYKAWVDAGRPRGNTRRMSEWMYNAFGDPFENGRALEAATTTSLSTIVKNTVNIILAADFAVRHQWWSPIVTEEEVDTIDQTTLARFYGVSNLDTVNEGAAYTEKVLTDEEETADFVKRGNYIGITLETLLRDKVNKVRRLPQLLADAWYNTLSNQVATVFTTNSAAGPALGDTGALFNATALTTAGGHANLLTTALSHTAYAAARAAMRKQTSGYLGTGPRLMIKPRYILVPVDLEHTAMQVAMSEQIAGSANNDVNPYYNEAQVIAVPEWTDANNWALVADPLEYPAIWLIYYRGNRVPELFTSDSETQGAMFTNDELRYKVRQLTFYFSSTYTCAPVSDWRPLHKSNVA